MYYFWLYSVFVAARGAFLAASTGYSLVAAGGASHSSGFSCRRAWALGMWASVVAGGDTLLDEKAESGNSQNVRNTGKSSFSVPHALSDPASLHVLSFHSAAETHSLRIYSVSESLVQETDMTGQWFLNFPVSGLLYTLLKITEDSKELLFLTY